MAEVQTDVKKIHAKVGEPFKIRIWEDRTRGSRYVPTYDSAVLKVVSDEYVRTRHIRTNDIGMHDFEFVPVKPGRYTIEFECRYGWKFSAEDRLLYVVEAAGTGA